MTTEIRSLRVSADMDANGYAAGAQKKVAADREMGASGKEAAAGIKAVGDAAGVTNTKITQAGDGIERLKRQYVTGYAASVDFERGLKTVGVGLDKGKISAEQASAAIENLSKKYGQVANASEIAQRGQISLSQAVSQANSRIATQVTTAEQSALAQRKMAAANQNMAGGGAFNTGNVAAQFQDIGVTAAMGMDPMMIALQQGTQLSAVLGPMGAAGAVKSLGAAFLSVISPVSLVTIALVAGAAALIQYFTTAEDGTGKTSKLFEEQNAVIRNAAKLWGDATPALKSYVDELDRADRITQGREAGEILAGRELDGLAESLQGIKQEFGGANRALAQLGADPAFIRDFGTAFGDLRAKLDDGTASIGDVNNAQRELAEAVANYGVKEVLKFRDAFDLVTEGIYRGVEAAGKARTAWISALAGGTNVQDIVAGSTFTENGKTFSAGNFTPVNAPRPGGRPLIELEGLPGDKKQEKEADAYRDLVKSANDRIQQMKLEADVAGQAGIAAEALRFELDLLQKAQDKGRSATPDQVAEIKKLTEAYREAAQAAASVKLRQELSWERDQLGRSGVDQQIASRQRGAGLPVDLNSGEAEQMRELERVKELRAQGKGFVTDLISGLRNGEKIGETFGKAILNGLARSADKQFDRLVDSFMSWLFPASGGSSAASAGTGVVGSILGAANDNKVTGMAPVIPVTRGALPPPTEISSYVAKAAAARGIDPDTALRVAKSEGGLDSWNLQSLARRPDGSREDSWGPFQLYKGGGLGNKFMAKTGLDPALAVNGPAGVDFALDEAKQNGWGAWYGAKKAGIGNFEGIDKTAKAIDGLGNAATETAKMTAGLGQTISSIPQALMANGGGAGMLSGLTKYGMGLFSGSAQFASAWMKGGIGLYADGTDSAPGGLAMVGERGRELVNLPRGSQVVPNHKTEAMLNRAANSNGGNAQPSKIDLHVTVMGGSGDEHVKNLARQGAQEVLGEYDIAQTRGGVGKTNNAYTARRA